MGLTPQQMETLTRLKQAYGGEAIWRPSAASRWMGPTACYGSIQMIAKAPKDRTSSPAAKEGTAGHAVGQSALTGGPQPDEWVGRHIELGDGSKETYFVNDEMGRHIQDYVDVVDIRTTVGATRFIEHKLTLAAADPSNPMLAECRGTADVALIDFNARWVEIIDLKYGKGVTVSSKSLQLRVYLLMLLFTFLDGKPWKTARTIVFQPRAAGDPDLDDDDVFDPKMPKIVSFDPGEIITSFLGDVTAAMVKALDPNPALNPTKDNCRWCPAGNSNSCPALRALGGFAAFESSVMGALPSLDVNMPMPPIPEHVVLSNGHAPDPPQADTVVLRSPLEMEAQEIARIMNIYEDRFKPWFAGVQHRAAQLAEAGIKIEEANGDGWVLRQRTGNRQFIADISEKKLAALLQRLGADIRDLYTAPKLKSVKQVESILPLWGKKLLKQLVHRPQGEVALVRKTASTVEAAADTPVLGSIAWLETSENNANLENNESA